MKKIIIAIAFLIAAFQLYAQNQKVIGGEEISILDAPYQVSLEIWGEHFCGGTIIDCEWILTAAHCVDYDDVEPEDIIVHAGVTDQTKNGLGQRIKVDRIIFHDDYYTDNLSPHIPHNDMVLLHLATPLKFNKTVRPIKYATPENTTFADITAEEVAFFSGWGDAGSGDSSDVLRGTSTFIISNEDAGGLLVSDNNHWLCRPPNANVVDDTMIATFKKGVGFGRADSGGPLVIGSGAKAILIGVVSWAGCPSQYFPNIYANVRNLSSWIDDTIGDDICFCNGFVNFHFEDKNKNDQNEFCVGEDVWIDGSATSNNANHYYMDLWTVDDNGDYDWISDSGWVAGSPNRINITDLFENDPEHPVDFKIGVTYALKLAIVDPVCRWVERYETFTIKRCCEELTAPLTNLRLNDSTLSWDPVPGAESYIVEVLPFGSKLFCNCNKYSTPKWQVTTSNTHATLPPTKQGTCYLVEVRAVCSDGTISEPSNPICVGEKAVIIKDGFGLQKVFVTPNPSKGVMTFNVLTSDVSEVSIVVHDIYGKRVKSLLLNTVSEKMSSVSWDESNLKKGIYFVTFKSNNETRYSKVIVE